MCFNKLPLSTRQLADRDIVCYKTVEFINKNKVRSILRGKKYDFDVLYAIKSDLDIKGKEIGKGFHSYRFYNEIMFDRLKGRLPGLIWRKAFKTDVAVRCIIPKGSYYWKNEKEFVSNQIIIKEFVK